MAGFVHVFKCHALLLLFVHAWIKATYFILTWKYNYIK